MTLFDRAISLLASDGFISSFDDDTEPMYADLDTPGAWKRAASSATGVPYLSFDQRDRYWIVNLRGWREHFGDLDMALAHLEAHTGMSAERTRAAYRGVTSRRRAA